MAITGNIQPQLDLSEHIELADGFKGKRVLPYELDGSGAAHIAETKDGAVKVTVSGTTTYVAKAAAGTAQSAASWKVKKIDASSGVVITWADGNTNYDNVATDLTALTYS